MVGGDYLVDQEGGRVRTSSNLTDTGGVIHMNHRASDMGYEGKHSGYEGHDRGHFRHGRGGDDDEEMDGAVRRHSYDFNAMGMQESSDLDGYSDGEGEDSGEGYGRGGMIGRK